MAGFPTAPTYAGWQVQPCDGGWRAFDTGIVSASLALAGTSVMPSDMAAVLAGVHSGNWAWDAHFETVRGSISGGSQAQVAECIGALVERIHALAGSRGRPANPLVADLIALKILVAENSPLKEAAWSHFFPGVSAAGEGRRDVVNGLRALQRKDAAAVVACWRPWLEVLGIGPFGRMLQAIYKADTEYALGGVAAAVIRELWSAMQGHGALAELLVELLLYFGRNDSVQRLLSSFPADALPACRSHLAALPGMEAAAQCRVSILLITWNRASLLDRTLDALGGAVVLPDTEILVALNGCTDDSEKVLARHGIEPVLRSPSNRGIDLYRDLFPLARGQVLLEIDDDITAFPPALDAMMVDHFAAFPAYGALSILPWIRQADGSSLPAQGVTLGRDGKDGKQVNQGSMWGCCLAIRREDFIAGNGFHGAELSKRLGEEDQLMRKLYMRQRKFGFIDCGGLEILP